jgi:hypothetical protein
MDKCVSDSAVVGAEMPPSCTLFSTGHWDAYCRPGRAPEGSADAAGRYKAEAAEGEARNEEALAGCGKTASGGSSTSLPCVLRAV